MPLGPPPTLESHVLLVLDDEVFLCLLQLFELILRVLSDEPQLLEGLVDLQVLLGHGVHQGARWGRALHGAQGALSTVREPSPSLPQSCSHHHGEEPLSIPQPLPLLTPPSLHSHCLPPAPAAARGRGCAGCSARAPWGIGHTCSVGRARPEPGTGQGPPLPYSPAHSPPLACSCVA